MPGAPLYQMMVLILTLTQNKNCIKKIWDFAQTFSSIIQLFVQLSLLSVFPSTKQESNRIDAKYMKSLAGSMSLLSLLK